MPNKESNTGKKTLVIVFNAVFAAILGLASVYGFDIGWYGAITGILVIVLDTWLAIEWIPPSKDSKED